METRKIQASLGDLLRVREGQAVEEPTPAPGAATGGQQQSKWAEGLQCWDNQADIWNSQRLKMG